MKSPRNTEIEVRSEPVFDFIDTVSKYAMGIGGAMFLICAGFAFFLVSQGASENTDRSKQIAESYSLWQNGMTIGVVIGFAGMAWNYYFEEVAVALNLAGAAIFYFFPIWGPLVFTGPGTTLPGFTKGLQVIQSAGAVWGLLAILLLLANIAMTVRQRMIHGTKADQLKFGKGVKQDAQRQNVFMGKCWQLPFCRQFVRAKCPIYHAKRTCWREQSGCMCEEQVIEIAMGNKVVSKDALLSGAAIPRNPKLTPAQKKERCKNCVIYNEHQKHKYRLGLPLVLVGYVLVYALFNQPLVGWLNSVVNQTSAQVNKATAGAVKDLYTGQIFLHFLVICLLVMLMTYTLKLLEFAIFKLKL